MAHFTFAFFADNFSKSGFEKNLRKLFQQASAATLPALQKEGKQPEWRILRQYWDVARPAG